MIIDMWEQGTPEDMCYAFNQAYNLGFVNRAYSTPNCFFFCDKEPISSRKLEVEVGDIYSYMIEYGFDSILAGTYNPDSWDDGPPLDASREQHLKHVEEDEYYSVEDMENILMRESTEKSWRYIGLENVRQIANANYILSVLTFDISEDVFS